MTSLAISACPVLVSPFPAPTPNTKFFSPISGPLPSVHHKSQPSPAFPQYFPNILSYARLWGYCSQLINFRFRSLNISSTLPLKGLKSPFKWLNNRYSNISSLNEVRRLLQSTLRPRNMQCVFHLGDSFFVVVFNRCPTANNISLIIVVICGHCQIAFNTIYYSSYTILWNMIFDQQKWWIFLPIKFSTIDVLYNDKCF